MQFKIVEHWNAYLREIPDEKKDLYYTEEYTKLYETGEDRALCIVGEDGEDIILMPFLRRKIRSYYDFETAYGYGGPISNSCSVGWIREALNQMQKFFRNNGYICGFIRFHPLLENALLCQDSFNVIYDRKTVVIDMRESLDDIWNSQISSKNRNMIRKAEKNGLIYKAEYDFSSLAQFVKLYNKTMERLGADDFYFFTDRYFAKLVESLRERAFLGTVYCEEKLVGAALFMKTGEYGHYHLAGSDRTKGSLGINNFLLWKTIEELSKMKMKYFHLGGGTGSSLDDSLYKFKKSFGKQERDFYIGKWIFDEIIYKEISDDWRRNNPELEKKYKNVLLKYRYTK